MVLHCLEDKEFDHCQVKNTRREKNSCANEKQKQTNHQQQQQQQQQQQKPIRLTLVLRTQSKL